MSCVEQGFSTSAQLTFGTRPLFVVRGCAMPCRMVHSLSGLWPLDASSTPRVPLAAEISPANISWRQNCPWLRTTALQVCILIMISMFGQEEGENDNSAITAKKSNQVHFSTETWRPSRDYGPGPGGQQKHLPHPLPPTPPQGFGGRPTALHNIPNQVNYTEARFSCCYLFKTLGFQEV